MLEKPRIFTAESIAGIVQEATHDLQRKQTVKITDSCHLMHGLYVV